MAIHYTHNEFMQAVTRQRASALANNLDTETIIMGSVQLYYEHKKNIAYLNHALSFARSKNGMRVNAVKSFLSHFTGAKLKGNEYIKAGDSNTIPAEFESLGSWVEWADQKAPEPTYDHKAMVLSLERYLNKTLEKAKEHDDKALIGEVTAMLAMAKRAV